MKPYKRSQKPGRALALTGGVLLSLVSITSAQAQPVQQNPAFAPVHDDPNLPRVLLIGDSISIGYTVPVRKALAEIANVHRIPVNGGTSSNGLLHIDEWLGDSRWDLIHFNWGLHDLWTTDGKQRIPADQYEKNLRTLVKRLKETQARLIWCSTTPVPADIEIKTRCDADVVAYNTVAKKVMEENGVPINDLYTFALPQLTAIQIPANVHFTGGGSKVLATQVSAFILKTLTEHTGPHPTLAAAVHAPDFTADNGGYHATGKGITLASSTQTGSGSGKSLKVTLTGGSGSVKSPAFDIVPTARTTRAVKGKDLAFWQVRYSLKTKLSRGTCRVRLRILDPDDPYEIGFDHFGGTATVSNGFTCVHKPLCTIVSTHPHKRRAAGDSNAELVLALDDAQGEVWFGDVQITSTEPGGPGFTESEWNAFETGDGIHYTGVTANMFQPEYTPKAPGLYVSKLVMDSAHKLFRTCGFNMIRLFTYWNDRNAHYPATQFQVIIWNSDPDGGTGDYEKSLNTLRDGIDNLAYYGLKTQLCLRGSPDWTHPRHQNNHETSSRKGAVHLANPGNPNGVGDPYPGPQYATNRHWLYPPDDWQTWRDFAMQLAAKLKGRGMLYEIMNEINVADQDALVGGYTAYLLWLKHFYEAAKPVDPDATILLADAGKLLPPLIAAGALDFADGVAFHLYAGELSTARAMVQSSGTKKHLYMSEYMKMRAPYDPALSLKDTTRQQVQWNAFSTLDFRHFANILTLTDAAGQPVYRDKPAGQGDRICLTTNYLEWGSYSGVLQQDDPEGRGGDRIRAEVLCNPQMTPGSSQTVTLRATNLSQTTFHNVRLWPVGFVDNLGFDEDRVRAADVRIDTFSPGQTHEITLAVKPCTTRYPAGGVYDIGLAIVNREARHSLALKSITLLQQK